MGNVWAVQRDASSERCGRFPASLENGSLIACPIDNVESEIFIQQTAGLVPCTRLDHLQRRLSGGVFFPTRSDRVESRLRVRAGWSAVEMEKPTKNSAKRSFVHETFGVIYFSNPPPLPRGRRREIRPTRRRPLDGQRESENRFSPGFSMQLL